MPKSSNPRIKDLSYFSCDKFKVLDRDNDCPKRGIMWKCICMCGVIFSTTSVSIYRGTSTGCGCHEAKLISMRSSLPPGEASVRRLFGIYKKGATKRKLSFNINLEEFRILIFGNCHYCNATAAESKCKFTRKNLLKDNTIYYNGIDRKDNLQGYNLDNCVSCCLRCNRAKLQLPYNEFTSWISRICKFNLNKI